MATANFRSDPSQNALGTLDLATPFPSKLIKPRQPATATAELRSSMTPEARLQREYNIQDRLASELGNLTAQSAEFEGLTKREAATRAAEVGKGERQLAEEKERTLAQPELREERRQLRKERGTPFVPTQENVQEMAAIFSFIGVLGFAIGGGGKSNAIGAMNAMNGMMEGYRQGSADRYEKEFNQFVTNMKSLDDRITNIDAELDDVAQLAAISYDKGMAKLKEVALQNEADFLTKYADKVGLPKTIALVKSLKEASDRNVDRLEKEISRAAEKQREENFRLAMQQRRENIQIVLANQKAAQRGKGGYQSALLAGRAENIREAFAQAAKDIVNITKMPPNTMLGTFAGLTGASADGMISGIRNAVARGVTDKEQRMLETLIAGIEGHMAFALGGGYATSQSKARMDQYKAQLARAGDDPVQVPLMLARFKQEMNILAENFGSKPGATEEMDNAVQKYNDNINAAIPFTVEDVLNSQFAPAAPKSKDSGGWTVREKK